MTYLILAVATELKAERDALQARASHCRQIIAEARQLVEDGEHEDALEVLHLDDDPPPEKPLTRYERSILEARVEKLREALRGLLRFNEDLCDDIGVSKHYPSAEKARAALAEGGET